MFMQLYSCRWGAGSADSRHRSGGKSLTSLTTTSQYGVTLKVSLKQLMDSTSTGLEVLPHGVPNLIYDSPGDFGALDFKIVLEPGAIDHVHNLYVDLNHAVFELVPRDFGDFIHQCYNELGRPVVDRRSAWNIYLDLHQIISWLYEQLPPVVLPNDNLNNDFLPLLENHEDLPFHDGNDGAYYMGGVGGGLGLHESHSRQLDILAEDDEPDVSLLEDTNIDESGHTGLVVWEFSDDEDGHVVDEW
ncbi:uncharacterized protein HD556DRAFT_1302417 [Suillus plorans]|uniref:Uncharacterized protein n=1 Tax=Suillus plorans TaxID=116603 RepID=A0A9P7J9S9_9AGAM|nr:uncharacterized protein HD556DRAFT_1302417 [Suillus plorans]KAG1810019.1 hypothetical protein HD556DRAFT_1302417 [Suillus plorans]